MFTKKAKKETKKTFIFTIRPSLHKEFKSLCKKYDIPMAKAIEQMMIDTIKKEKDSLEKDLTQDN